MAPKGSISQRVRELAQLVRAGVLYASGHRFNPCIPYHRQGGSISQRGLGVVAQSVEASDLKSVQSGFESQLPYHHRGGISQRYGGGGRNRTAVQTSAS